MTATVRKIERKANPDMVRMIEDILEDAKAGRIVDIVIVGTSAEEGSAFDVMLCKDRWRLLGLIEHAKHSILER
jgi:hypothetical protein